MKASGEAAGLPAPGSRLCRVGALFFVTEVQTRAPEAEGRLMVCVCDRRRGESRGGGVPAAEVKGKTSALPSGGMQRSFLNTQREGRGELWEGQQWQTPGQ